MITHLNEAISVRIHYYVSKGKSFRKKKLIWESCSDDEARGLVKAITDRFPNGHQCIERKATFWESYGDSLKLCTLVFLVALFYWWVGLFDPQFQFEFESSAGGRRGAKLFVLDRLYQLFVVAPAYFIPRWFWSLLVFGIPVLAFILAANRVDSRMKASDYIPNSQ